MHPLTKILNNINRLTHHAHQHLGTTLARRRVTRKACWGDPHSLRTLCTWPRLAPRPVVITITEEQPRTSEKPFHSHLTIAWRKRTMRQREIYPRLRCLLSGCIPWLGKH